MTRRTQPLPKGWDRLSRRIIRRDHGICHICGQRGADQTDHIIPASQGGTDHPTNLAAIHADPCHRDKTQREAAQANPLAKPRRRQAEPHPGEIAQGGEDPPSTPSPDRSG